MKEKRQQLIRSLIARQSISTQQQLMQALAQEGIAATQATLSRDIREMGVVKQPDAQGALCYALPVQREQGARFSLSAVAKASVLHVDNAMNTVVIKCRSGLANAACAELDGLGLDWIVGTIAGDDTIFVLLRTQKQAAGFAAQLRRQLK